MSVHVRIRRAVIPGVLTAGGCVLAISLGSQLYPQHLNTRSKIVLEILSFLPYFPLLLSAFLATQLSLIRVTFAALGLAAAYGVLLHLPVGSLLLRAQAVSLAFPLSLGLNFFFHERRLRRSRIVSRISAILIPILLMVVGIKAAETAMTEFLGWQWLFYFKDWHLPDLCLLLFVATIAALVWRADRYIRDLTAPFLIGLVPVVFALNQAGLGNGFEARYRIFLCFFTSSSVLLATLFRLSWQKVYIDELSGIPNRRALDEKLAGLEENYCIAMVDIDFFKKFNDTYGHEQGDNVIRFVGNRLDFWSGSRAYRYGGEEFCLVFENMQLEQAQKIAERARKFFSDFDFIIRGNTKENRSSVHVTISIGLASCKRANAEMVLKAADKALYDAKKNGRNRIEAVCF
jgi:diguanylate cyclase (GGDEF)-like protein